jgi:hypothetical protein
MDRRRLGARAWIHTNQINRGVLPEERSGKRPKGQKASKTHAEKNN